MTGPARMTGPIRTVDYHTAGEPFRIVLDGVALPPGDTVAARRQAALSRADGGVADDARRVLCSEPRGHADMYGCFIVPPDPVPEGSALEPAALGVLFWHKDGFSTACGHGTIALATWAVDSGRVQADPDGVTEFAIDVPSGRVEVKVGCADGRVEGVVFRNVPSWVSATTADGIEVPTSAGTIRVAVSFGGAFYASVPANPLGAQVRPKHLYDRILPLAREIAAFFRADPVAMAAVTHPTDDRLSGLYGSIFFEDLTGFDTRDKVWDDERAPADDDRAAQAALSGSKVVSLRQRNVTVFADGEVDRSPCGSGTSARLAVLYADDDLDLREPLRHESIIGSSFLGRVVGEVAPTAQTGGREAVMTEVVGSAYRTGEHTFVVDDRDPLARGFLLR